jgi:SAM-dependent methyltransferase
LNDDYFFNIKRKRPEELYEKASDYFDLKTLSNYAKSKSIMRAQIKMTQRALEILELQKNHCLILDAGCGPGFAAIYLNQLGHKTIALDFISDFLKFFDIKDLNPILADMSYTPFQSKIFDAIISISALQWIFKEIGNKIMRSNLISLFRSFYNILKPNSKAVIQFYPKNNVVMENIGKIIRETTQFSGTFIIDNPNNPKKRKMFLVLEKKI